jgi:hypothetical protein
VQVGGQRFDQAVDVVDGRTEPKTGPQGTLPVIQTSQQRVCAKLAVAEPYRIFAREASGHEASLVPLHLEGDDPD